MTPQSLRHQSNFRTFVYKEINEVKSLRKPSVKLKSSLKASYIQLYTFPNPTTDLSQTVHNIKPKSTSTNMVSAQPLEIQTTQENKSKTEKSTRQPISKQSTLVSQPSKETETGITTSSCGSESPSQESISKPFKREPGGSQIPIAGALFIATCLGSPVCVVAGLKLGMFATPRARCLQNMSKLTLQRVSPILKILPFNAKLKIAV